MKLLLAGNPNGAIEQFKASLSADSSYGDAHRGLGLSYEKLGKKARARREYRRYLRRRPTAPDAKVIRKRLRGLN